MKVIEAVIFAIGYVVLAGILGIEWGTCVNMTGVLWIGIAEHYFNNFIGNILHVVSSSGTDELQIVRIVLSNVLSLVIVLGMKKVNCGIGTFLCYEESSLVTCFFDKRSFDNFSRHPGYHYIEKVHKIWYDIKL